MTKYAKLKAMKDNFIHAASKAKDHYMIALWIQRAEETQKKMDELSIEEAEMEVEA